MAHERKQERRAEAKAATAAETKRTLDRFAADVKDAGRDLRILHELGMKTHGIDPRFARDVHLRMTRAVRDIVRALDQDGAAILPPIVDRAVLAAVERHLCARAAAAEEADKHRPN
ncbi:MAG: hypothetical protein WA864_00555 [Acetobacteraceae bacterium]